MRVIFSRFLNLSAQNVTEEIFWVLGLIYFVALVVVLFGIWGLSIRTSAKVAWTLLTIVLPVVGPALFCVRCLFKADYSFLQQFGMKSSSKKTKSQLPSASH